MEGIIKVEEEHKKCRKCKQLLPVSKFNRKLGYQNKTLKRDYPMIINTVKNTVVVCSTCQTDISNEPEQQKRWADCQFRTLRLNPKDY